jgi:hypothetical protein
MKKAMQEAQQESQRQGVKVVPRPAAPPQSAKAPASAPPQAESRPAPVPEAPKAVPQAPPPVPEPKMAMAPVKPAPAEPKAPVPQAEPKIASLPPTQASPSAAPMAMERPARAAPMYNDLMSAVLAGDSAAVQDLLSLGKWPDKPDSNGTTPLVAAVMRGDRANAELLLKAGADASPALSTPRARNDPAMRELLESYRR